MTTAQRIAISLLSVLLTLAIAAPCLGVLASPHDPKLWPIAIVGFFFYGLLFCSAGWVIALPMVLMIRRTDGWHFWTALAVGTAIGPITVMLFAAYQRLKSNSPLTALFSSWNPMSNILTWIAAAISLLAALLFLLILRQAQRRQKTPSIPSEIAIPDNEPNP